MGKNKKFSTKYSYFEAFPGPKLGFTSFQTLDTNLVCSRLPKSTCNVWCMSHLLMM